LAQDWPSWQAAVEQARSGPAILLATSVGGHVPTTLLDGLLAVALTLRGANVHLLLCDGILPACVQAVNTDKFPPNEFASQGPQPRWCQGCSQPSLAFYQGLGLPLHSFSQLVEPGESVSARALATELSAADLAVYRSGGAAVGEHARAGTLRYFARGDLDATAHSDTILRRYFEAALLTLHATTRLLAANTFESVSLTHGIYVPHGVVCDVARQAGVRVTTWNTAYRKNCFIFSHGDTYHRTLLDEPQATWENLALTEAMEAQLMGYLRSRAQGTQDWIKFTQDSQEALSAAVTELGVDFSRPSVGLLTNVVWDAQLMYRGNAFAGMIEWVVETIRYFAARSDLQLIIRVHPAEVRGTLRSRQPIQAEIQRVFPVLPANVFIIPPESMLSTYTVMSQCNTVLIYGTKTGVELACQGIPVIVAGEAWLRNKGLTLDASSPAEYFSLLDRLPLPARMEAAQVRRARQYAYHFFFRRMIPLEMLEPTGTHPPFRLAVGSLDALRPGRSPGLDVICDGLLHGTDYVFPAEVLDSQPASA
jgi:hypothetical protein